MQASPQAFHLIKKFETFSQKPYLTRNGLKKIGFGHIIKADENEKFTLITYGEGEAILAQDVEPIENFLNKFVRRFFNQNQFDALISFVFDTGLTHFMKSKVLFHLLKNEDEIALQYLKGWKKPTHTPSLKGGERRETEVNLFRKQPRNLYIPNNPFIHTSP